MCHEASKIAKVIFEIEKAINARWNNGLHFPKKPMIRR
jgi:hypothetical protein